ncbi:MAG TPA: hypothetical protein VM142_03980 [Acidimicrobiales bacterium]|nr:hypothetical protein [Acidimicrobiales bacterium]
MVSVVGVLLVAMGARFFLWVMQILTHPQEAAHERWDEVLARLDALPGRRS